MSKFMPPVPSRTASPAPGDADSSPPAAAGAQHHVAGRRITRTCAVASATGIIVPFAAAAIALFFGAPQIAMVACMGGCVASITALYLTRAPRRPSGSVDAPTARDVFVAGLDEALAGHRGSGRAIGAFVLELDNYKKFEERHSHEDRAILLRECSRRLTGALGPDDRAGRVEGPCFIVSHAPDEALDLERAIRFATGLQALLSAPLALPGGNVYPSVSVGFALSERAALPTGEGLLQSAMSAMIEAQRSGPGAIRSFSAAMRDRIAGRARLVTEVRQALEDGQIAPFFQPQTRTDTGALTGFETLARWHHPERGMIPPSEFLPAIEEAGLMERLGDLMTREALSAMRQWEDAGLYVPQVGVNFSTFELSNPTLADKITATLDDFALTPDRLTIEVLETVVAGQHDHFVTQNLSKLAAMGCRLDLDDFGTGHASITSIRRFSIARIKIDRTFVTRIDEDEEQQDMVAAILTMADRLGLEALAEGVETSAELARLRQLGCTYVQGFGIARPMPLTETFAWIEARVGRATHPVQLRARSA